MIENDTMRRDESEDDEAVDGRDSHVVSGPEASSPASLVVPVGHATQALFETYSFSAHSTAACVVVLGAEVVVVLGEEVVVVLGAVVVVLGEEVVVVLGAEVVLGACVVVDILQLVSDPEASSPASFSNPGAQLRHAFPETYSFAAQMMASQVVSDPEASSPAAFEVPGAQLRQTLLETY
jgi:hypothetical protein